MDNEVKTWLYDVLQAITEIEGYFENKPLNCNDYFNDIKTKRAVERGLEIIGEAINRIHKKQKDIELTNALKIIGARNRIIHGYDRISDDLVWSIVINHLPKLHKEVSELLNEETTDIR